MHRPLMRQALAVMPGCKVHTGLGSWTWVVLMEITAIFHQWVANSPQYVGMSHRYF